MYSVQEKKHQKAFGHFELAHIFLFQIVSYVLYMFIKEIQYVLYNAVRNYVEHNSVENVSQDLVHPTKSDTASASLILESEEREEITETADVPAPAPKPAPATALERVEEQSHTPGSRKSTRKNLGRPASSYSDFYM